MTVHTIPALTETGDGPVSLSEESALVRDPVCGMTFHPDEAAATRVVDGMTNYFCAERCAREFDRHRSQNAASSEHPTVDGAWPATPASQTMPQRLSAQGILGTLGTLSRSHWLMLAMCLAPAAAIVAVRFFGLSVSNLLIFAIVLLCPLSHVLMMRGHGSHDDHGWHSAQDGHGRTTFQGQTASLGSAGAGNQAESDNQAELVSRAESDNQADPGGHSGHSGRAGCH